MLRVRVVDLKECLFEALVNVELFSLLFCVDDADSHNCLRVIHEEGVVNGWVLGRVEMQVLKL